VLATRGSPATDNPSDLDVAEFFVLRAHRASGIGAQAACLLWDQLPGHWVVRAAVKNEAAVRFWRRTIASYAAGAHVERVLELRGVVRQVFEFRTRSTHSG
jgi:predicted acetyltransferase